MQEGLNKIIIIGGPTASGKSELALKVADLTGGEIINADAIQVYKDLPILAAIPSEAEQKTVPHHLYGFLDYKVRFSVAEWLELSVKKINELLAKGKAPILVGGTGMYIHSLINGIREVQDIPKEVQLETNKLLETSGLSYLYGELQKIDTQLSEYFPKTDRNRTIRAFNLYKAFNITPTEYRNLPNKEFFSKDVFLNMILSPAREGLYDNCNKRFFKMVEFGALDEVKRLKNLGATKGDPIAKTIGFKQFFDYLEGDIDQTEAIEIASQETRNFAKRQMTWFKNQLNENIDNIVKEDMIELLKEFQNRC